MANGELEKLDTFSVEFGIRGLNEKEVFTLENARVVPRLPDLSGNIPSAQDIARNSHLAGIEIPMVSGLAKVQVIVGIDSPALHVFSEIRQDGESRLWAGKSPLGWVLHGRDLTATSNARHSVNLLVDSRANPVLDAHCPCQFDYVDRACDPEVHCLPLTMTGPRST